MNKLLRFGNWLSLLLILAGAVLWLSYGTGAWKGRAGLGLLLLGAAGLAAYFAVHFARFRTRNARLNFLFASNLAVVVLLVTAIVAAVNYLGTRVHQRVDFSAGKVHSLSPQSVQVARGIKKDLVIKAFFGKENRGRQPFLALLEIYRFHNPRIRAEVIDPFLKPEMVKRHDVKADGTLVFEYGGKSTRSEEATEEAITNAIVKVTRRTEKTVYFAQGHGEPGSGDTGEAGYSEARSGLEKLSYKVKDIVLFQEPSVPADAAALVIAGPRKPLLEKELLLLEDYLEKRQGRLLLLLDPGQGAELRPLLAKRGLALEENVVVDADPLSQFMGGSYVMPVVAKYPEHAVTKGFGYATMFPLVRGLARLTPAPAGTTVDFLAATSPESWGETRYEAEAKTERIAKDPEDKAGPIDIAAAIEASAGDGKSRLVAVGDSDFALNQYYFFQANGSFFNNAVSWLAEEQDLIAIPPKVTAPRTINLTQSAGRLAFFYSLIILPLLVFAAGIGIWLYRRKL